MKCRQHGQLYDPSRASRFVKPSMVFPWNSPKLGLQYLITRTCITDNMTTVHLGSLLGIFQSRVFNAITLERVLQTTPHIIALTTVRKCARDLHLVTFHLCFSRFKYWIIFMITTTGCYNYHDPWSLLWFSLSCSCTPSSQGPILVQLHEHNHRAL